MKEPQALEWGHESFSLDEKKYAVALSRETSETVVQNRQKHYLVLLQETIQ